MEEKELMERYIYAVVKQLPSKIREDVSKEIRSLIEDMLEERCKGMPITQKDVRVVLTELGTPSELAMNYNPEKNSYLIGPMYYGSYKKLLKIVFFATALGMTVSGMLSCAFGEWSGYVPLEVGEWIGTSVMGGFYAFGFITFLFAIFERKGIKIDFGKENIDDLPPIPQKEAVIGKTEGIFGIAVAIVFLVIFLMKPEVFCIIITKYNIRMSFFNIEVIHSIWYLFVLLFTVGMIKEGFKMYEGRYTKRLILVTLFVNVATFVCMYLMINTKGIINPDITRLTKQIFEDGSSQDFRLSTIAQIKQLVVGIVTFSLLLDLFITTVKGFKYDHK